MDTKKQIKQNEQQLEQLLTKCTLCQSTNPKNFIGQVITNYTNKYKAFKPFLMYKIEKDLLRITTYDKKPIISIDIDYCPKCRQATKANKGGTQK